MKKLQDKAIVQKQQKALSGGRYQNGYSGRGANNKGDLPTTSIQSELTKKLIVKKKDANPIVAGQYLPGRRFFKSLNNKGHFKVTNQKLNEKAVKQTIQKEISGAQRAKYNPPAINNKGHFAVRSKSKH